MIMPARSRFSSWFRSPAPTVGVEISARRVTAVVLDRQADRFSIMGHASELLPDGAVVPALATPNLVQKDVVARAVKSVLQQVGARSPRVALVVPDGAAKVSLVKFDKVPARQDDLAQLVRWQVKKSVPFPLEQAQISWSAGVVDAAQGREFIVAIARRDVIEEYEGACIAAGASPGVVDLATFNLINVALMSDPALITARTPDGSPVDWLLVHVGADSSTIVVVRGADVIFFRNRPGESEGRLSDLVHQTAMYYEDRLGGRGFTRAFVSSRDLPAEAVGDVAVLAQSLAERVGDAVQVLDVRAAAALTDRIAPQPELLSTLAAPVGIVLREAEA